MTTPKHLKQPIVLHNMVKLRYDSFQNCYNWNRLQFLTYLEFLSLETGKTCSWQASWLGGLQSRHTGTAPLLASSQDDAEDERHWSMDPRMTPWTVLTSPVTWSPSGVTSPWPGLSWLPGDQYQHCAGCPGAHTRTCDTQSRLGLDIHHWNNAFFKIQKSNT